MARSKKDFSKEAMYKKIMPSILVEKEESELSDDDNIQKADNVNIFADKINILDKKDLSQLLTEDVEANKTLNSNKFIKMDMSDKLFKKTPAVDEAFDKIEKAMLSKEEVIDEKEEVNEIDENTHEDVEEIQELEKIPNHENHHDFKDPLYQEDEEDNYDKPYTREQGEKLLERLRNFRENKEWDDEEEEEEIEEETVERKAYKDMLFEKGYISVNPLRYLIKKKLRFALTKFQVKDEKQFVHTFMRDMLEKYPCEEVNGVEKDVTELLKNFEDACEIDFTSEIIKAIILDRKRNK